MTVALKLSAMLNKYFDFVLMVLCLIVPVKECLAQNTEQNRLIVKQIEIDFDVAEGSLVVEQGSSTEIAVPLAFSQKELAGPGGKSVLFMAAELDRNWSPLIFLLSGKTRTLPASAVARAVSVDSAELIEFQNLLAEESKLNLLEAELKSLEPGLERARRKVSDLKLKLAEISRLSRLVEGENTVLSLTRRLAELEADKLAINTLMEMVPHQNVSARMAPLEGQLSQDLRKLSDQGTGAAEAKGLSLSDEKREELRQLVEQAKGLNLADLKRQIALRAESTQSEQDNSDKRKESIVNGEQGIDSEDELPNGSAANPW